MCVDSDGCEIEGCSSSDEVHTLSGSMSPALNSSPDLHPCKPGQKFRAALLRCRSPLVAAGILSFGNVLNYMDRYTVAGVLLDIQKHFEVGDSGAGLLQTVFICSFMVAAPIFGYLGDRFNRKIILSCGIFFWSFVTLLSSFITKDYYWLLVLSRCLVGIGESSYSSISPTIIGDLFTNNKRTMMLSVFYLAIPLGSGLGYILGSIAKDAGGHWYWALRVSPMLGLIAGTLVLIFVTEPKRGSADHIAGRMQTRTSWLCDMKALAKNRSYVFSSLASAAVSFATGAFGIWIPQYLVRAQVVQKTAESCTSQPCSSKDSLLHSVGLTGIVAWQGCYILLTFLLLFFSPHSLSSQICIFIGETLLFLNWAITADILMFVVIPTRRATAVAFQGFTSHLLGDAGSPYLIGLISDSLQESYATSILWQFLSLGYALMLCPFVIVLGGMFFLATALFFLEDRDKAEKQ
uniref:Sphingolipid transporter 2 n=1 Tax=Cyprinus carpio TaxID=7962 RepID=A0A8C1QRB9_CYPCA